MQAGGLIPLHQDRALLWWSKEEGCDGFSNSTVTEAGPGTGVPEVCAGLGDRAAFLLSVIGIANTVARLILGWLSDRTWINRYKQETTEWEPMNETKVFSVRHRPVL